MPTAAHSTVHPLTELARRPQLLSWRASSLSAAIFAQSPELPRGRTAHASSNGLLRAPYAQANPATPYILCIDAMIRRHRCGAVANATTWLTPMLGYHHGNP